ncbi:MAG: polysaccharide biosynthesis protein [Firmicutes bacterium]|nr:polysaccharide biosynthesis protein [Bacillota bacterium]
MYGEKSLWWGTFWMLVSNIAVKGLGFFYRVVMVRLLGAEGMGLIEMVTPLYAFLLVLAGLGIQPALSQKIAQNDAAHLDYLHTGRQIMLAAGVVLTVLAYLLCEEIVAVFAPDPRIYLCFRTLLPAVPIVSIASAYRGWFQGRRQIAAIGGSQTAEQMIRVLCGVYLTKLMLDLPLSQAVSAASLATVCGELGGFLLLLLLFWRQNHGSECRRGRFSPAMAKELLRYGLPVTAGRLVNSGILMAQAFLIPWALQKAGWDMRGATEIYGRFSGVAMTLLHLPGVFTAALSVAVLPAVAETLRPSAKDLLQKRICQSLSATVIFTLPGMAILYLYAGELTAWIFDTPLAAPILRVLAAGGVFWYIQVTLLSILQGMGAAKQVLYGNILSGALLLLGAVLFTPLPQFGILGAALAADCAWCGGAIFNAWRIQALGKLRIPWDKIVQAPALSLAAALACRMAVRPLLEKAVTQPQLAAATAGVFLGVYLLAIWRSGALKRR